ncbi:MAG: chemotaxis protein CheB [Schwartzia sp. (in: firmicutes)]
MAPVRLMIVDDSKIFCQMLKDDLEKFLPEGSEIIVAHDAIAAWAQLISFRPSIILLDEEMPRMDGASFLRWLKNADISVPTALISGNPAYREKACTVGAALFLLKPSGSFVGEAPSFFQMVRDAVRQLADMPVHLPDAFVEDMSLDASSIVSELTPKELSALPQPLSLIAIGASTGGTEALAMLLAKLQPPLPPILVVQHLTNATPRRLADRLDIDAELVVTEAMDGELILPDHVYIAPSGKHLRVRRIERDLLLSCTAGSPINAVCPSIDVLFDSVASTVGQNALGLILTGTGTDGARGMLRMRQAGARTFGQDEASSAVYDMPRAAWEMGGVETQLPLQCMAKAITRIARQQPIASFL